MSKSIDNFNNLIKPIEILSYGTYKVSTSRRMSLIFPIGTEIFDVNENAWYLGDSSTLGGVEFHSGDTITTTNIIASNISGNNISGVSTTFTNISGINISGNNVVLGDFNNGNYTKIHSVSGYIQASGAAIMWDDLRFPFTTTRINPVSDKPDFDETNVGYLFPQNDNTEILYTIGQMPHTWKIGSDVGFHIHWTQSTSGYPTWFVSYQWNQNGAIKNSFSTVSGTSGIFSYVSGDLQQITEISDITPPANITGVSSVLKFKIWRDDNDVSGDVLGDEFDIHYQVDSLGSDQEFSKTF